MKIRLKRPRRESGVDAAHDTAVATIWIAVFTVLLAAVNGGTLHILNNQLEEMHGGGIDTHNLADAAQKQSTLMKGLADAARLQSENTAKLAQTAGDQLDQLRNQLATMRSQFRFSQNETQAEQRAWIDLSYDFPPDLDVRFFRL